MPARGCVCHVDAWNMNLVPLKWDNLSVLGSAFYWCHSVLVHCTNLRLKCYTLNCCEQVILKYLKTAYTPLIELWLVKMLINNNLDFISFLIKEQFSTFDGEDHECALWLLLKRTQSEDKAIRLQAVQDLASNRHWHGNVCSCSLIGPKNSRVSVSCSKSADNMKKS